MNLKKRTIAIVLAAILLVPEMLFPVPAFAEEENSRTIILDYDKYNSERSRTDNLGWYNDRLKASVGETLIITYNVNDPRFGNNTKLFSFCASGLGPGMLSYTRRMINDKIVYEEDPTDFYAGDMTLSFIDEQHFSLCVHSIDEDIATPSVLIGFNVLYTNAVGQTDSYYLGVFIDFDETIEPTPTITLDHSVLTVPIGEPELPEDEVQLKAYVNGEETTNVIWETDNDAVSIDGEGKLTGIFAAWTKVTAYTPDRKASASCDIVVGYTEQMKALVLAILANEPQKAIGAIPSGNLREFGAKLKSGKVWVEDPKWNDVNVSLRKIVRDVLGELEVVEYVKSTPENKGFQALCAKDIRDGKTYIVFGGTDLTVGEGDISTNYLYMVNNQLNLQFDLAWQFYNKHSTDNCVLVGYSLGGSLSAYVSMLSGERAYTFNGTNGLILDDTYMVYEPDSGAADGKKAQSSEIFNSFHGADLWDFHNYIARGAGSALLSNYNIDKYKHSIHTEERRAVTVGTHSYYSLFHFEPESNTFLFNLQEEFGGAAQNSFQIGNVLFGTSGDERLNVALSPGLTKLELAELMLLHPLLGELGVVLSTIFGKGWGYGGDGNDIIRTGLQSDILVGGPGVNELYGGGGNDLYVITDNSSCYIEDPSGNDEIRLVGVSDYVWHEFLDPRSLVIYLSTGEQIAINLNRNFLMPGTMKLTDQYGSTILDLTKWLNLPMSTDYTKLSVGTNTSAELFPNSVISAFVIEGDATLTVLDNNNRQVAYAVTGGEQQRGDENGFYYPSEDGIVAYLPDIGYSLLITGSGCVSVSGIIYNDNAELDGIYSVTDVDLSGGQTLLASTGNGEMLLRDLSGNVSPLVVDYEIPILSMQLNEEAGLNIKLGESRSLSLEVTPSDATQAKYWFSSDPDILMVDNAGVITGVAEGTALVYVLNRTLQEYDIISLTVGTGNTGADAKEPENTNKDSTKFMFIIGLSAACLVLLSIGITSGIILYKRKKRRKSL